jgi:two-component SAPR family response regulator
MGMKKKRRFLIYFAINLLTESVDFKIDIMGNKAQIDSIMKKIGLVYKDVKKNEVTLGDDYLFMGVERSNLDKTIERLEKMNELMH